MSTNSTVEQMQEASGDNMIFGTTRFSSSFSIEAVHASSYELLLPFLI